MSDALEDMKPYLAHEKKIFWIMFPSVFILNVLIILSTIKYFENYKPNVCFILGILGTFIVGLSNYNSEELIKQYSLTKVGCNPDIVKMLSKSKLYTSCGTVFLFSSILLGYLYKS